jgi:hypothetical protein
MLQFGIPWRSIFPMSTMSFLLLHHRRASVLAAALLLALLWGALAPLRDPSHERVFVFAGSAGKPGEPRRVLALPRELRLTLGVQDVLLLRNLDRVPQVFGPVQLPPGQEFRLPFEQAGKYVFACPAVAGGQLLVHVVRLPDPGWERLRWRLGAFGHALKTLPLVAPES